MIDYQTNLKLNLYFLCRIKILTVILIDSSLFTFYILKELIFVISLNFLNLKIIFKKKAYF